MHGNKCNCYYLVTASTTSARASPVLLGISDNMLQLIKVCKASNATDLYGPAKYGARSTVTNGDITSIGSTASDYIKYENTLTNVDKIRT